MTTVQRTFDPHAGPARRPASLAPALSPGCALPLVLILLLAGCGDDSRGGPDSGVPWDAFTGDVMTPAGSLRLDPADAEMSVRSGVTTVQDYRAFLVQADGSEVDVTAEATFWVADPPLGSFTGSRFTASGEAGGRTRVLAMARGAMGSTSLTVRLTRVIIVDGAPADAPDRFTGMEDATGGPEVVYPPDGTLVPPNLNELEIHYMPSGSTLFELDFRGSALALRVYFVCETLGAGCVYTPDEDVWRLISDAERGLDPATYRIRGVSDAGGTVHVSAERTIGFAEEDITGGLYYWNAGAGAVLRYDFGRRGQSAEPFLDGPRAGALTCVGCHVLSRDGSRIAVGLDIPSPSPYKVYDVSTRTQIYQQGSTFGGGANFFTFSPDNTQIMTSNGVSITLRNATDGSPITDPLVATGAMPDWSPDGLRMVYAKPAMAPPCFGGICGAPGVQSASLETMVLMGGSWSDGPTLVPFAGANSYYPVFAPDGRWVLFNQSPSNHDSYDSPDAQVWVVSADGGTPIHLANASTGGDSWPKWDPTVYQHRGHDLMWLTFSSRRAFGLRLAEGERAQLFMAAFEPARLMAGETDPSYPAFWMPFQDISSGNHIAQWVTHVDRQPCSSDGECGPGEFCTDGYCFADLI